MTDDHPTNPEAAATRTPTDPTTEPTAAQPHRTIGVVYEQAELGRVLTDIGRHAEAEKTLREALATARRVSGVDHMDVTYPLVGLARVTRAGASPTPSRSPARLSTCEGFGSAKPTREPERR